MAYDYILVTHTITLPIGDIIYKEIKNIKKQQQQMSTKKNKKRRNPRLAKKKQMIKTAPFVVGQKIECMDGNNQKW